MQVTWTLRVSFILVLTCNLYIAKQGSAYQAVGIHSSDLGLRVQGFRGLGLRVFRGLGSGI